MSLAAAPFQRWLCEACGLIYDEARGDPDSGLAAGTRFEDIPEDWHCPVCGVGKADFRKIGPVSPVASAVRAAADRRQPAARDAGVLIVGAGTAGWGVARALREADHAGPIAMVTACEGALYPKPTLSVALSRGLSPSAIVERPGPALAADLDVRLHAHAWAVELDLARRRLFTTRGTLRFEALVLATGARARRPALPGAGASRLFAINDLAAYSALRTAFESARPVAAVQGRAPRLVIIGAGLVGCELADDFAGAGAQVTMLEATSLPLAARLDAATAMRLRDALAGRGVRFEGDVTIDAVDGTNDPGHASSAIAIAWTGAAGAEHRHFDLGVLAVGTEAETRLARRAGLAVSRGIVVDAATLACLVAPGDGRLPTTRAADRADRVWAIGDCAEVDGRVGGTVEPIQRQARTIAGAIVGRPEPFSPRDPVWVLKTPSLPLTIRPVRAVVGR